MHENHEECTCSPELNAAYNKMRLAIEEFVRTKEGDNALYMTDFIVYAANNSFNTSDTKYVWATSPSAPHIQEGLLVLAGRDLIDDELDQRY